MKKLTPLLAIAGAIFVPGLLATPAYALSQPQDTTYVDPVSGDDNNFAAHPPCNPTAPCLSFQTALDLTNSPGTVVVVRGGTFPPVTITGGQSITCKAVSCIFDASGGGTGITISAGATDTVGLDGVSVVGFGTGATGISVTQIGKLELKDVNVSGNAVGLSFSPGGSGTSHLFVMDSEIRNASTQNVVLAPTGSVAVSAEFTRSRVHHGNAGFLADATKGTGGVSVVISDSQIGFANNNAVNANGNASGAGAQILLNSVTVSHSSGNGVTANGATGLVTLYNSEVTQTATAIAPFSGGQIISYGNNAINFNTSNGTTPTLTPLH